MPPRSTIWRIKYLAHSLVLTISLSALLMAPTSLQATHKNSEPSDGTVRSFIAIDPPREITPFVFYDRQGREITLASLRGKIVLLNLWATWCPPCVREMPALDRLQAKFAKTDFVVVPLSLDRGGLAMVEAFYQRYGLRSLGVYSDPQSKASAVFPVDVLPASFIVSRNGRVLSMLRSFVDWDDPLAEIMIRSLIATPKNQDKR